MYLLSRKNLGLGDGRKSDEGAVDHVYGIPIIQSKIRKEIESFEIEENMLS